MPKNSAAATSSRMGILIRAPSTVISARKLWFRTLRTIYRAGRCANPCSLRQRLQQLACLGQTAVAALGEQLPRLRNIRFLRMRREQDGPLRAAFEEATIAQLF